MTRDDIIFVDDLVREADVAAAKMRTNFFDRMDKGASDVSESLDMIGMSFTELSSTIEQKADEFEYFDKIRLEADAAAADIRTKFFEKFAEDAKDTSDTVEKARYGLELYGGAAEVAFDKAGDAAHQFSVQADQAARNIQDSFADFLFDPFQDGLRGMLTGFINVLRRMVAEMAAAKIFGSKQSGGMGGADFLGTIFNGLFGGGGTAPSTGGGSFVGPRATGGPVRAGGMYRVNENEMEFFRPSQSGEVIPLSKMGGRGSGQVVNIVNKIDARGATVDAIRALPEMLRRNNEQVKSDIITGLRRGKYQV